MPCIHLRYAVLIIHPANPGSPEDTAMAYDRDPQDHSREELEATIQRLQQELDFLRGQARAQQREHESARAWLIETIRQLLTEHSNSSITYTLEQLGQVFALCACTLWRRDRQQQVEICAEWHSGNLHTDSRWLNALLTEGVGHLIALQHGQPQILPDALTPATLSDLGIRHNLLVPIQRNHRLEGFLVLHSMQPRTWPEQYLEQIHVLADVLYSVQDRQHLLRTLADRDIRFQYAMEASRDGLWDWNITTGQIYFSRSYLRMLGYRNDELPPTLDTLRDHFLHPDDAEKVIAQYMAAIENQRPNLNLEFRMLHQDGSVLWIYSRAKFVEPDESGRARRCVGINANVTEFINAREELLAAKTQADTANKTKSEFLARMSHEIRTPLNAIIGLGHLLGETALNDQQQSYLNSVSTAAESLLQIVNQVLDFSKIESGKIMLENAHFDLSQVFEKISRLFEISALHRTVDIVYDIHSDVPRFLRGDASRLSQIISHLITNALQYSTTNQVVVGVTRVKSNTKYVTLEFTITDFGVGMSPEQVEQLQAILLKGGPDLRGNDGVGLSICNHLVSLMDGRIQIRSKEGQGCKISFTARFENSHIGARSVHEQPHSLNKLRTLVVDDNTIARNIIASTAHSLQMHTDLTDSAANALEKIRAADAAGKPYHLVLMDYKMPLINGLQATAMIKQDTTLRNVPVVLLISSYHRDEIFKDNDNAMLVDGFLAKPVSESRLFDSISQVITQDHPLHKLMSPDSDESVDDDEYLCNLRVLLVEDNLVNQQVARGILKKKNVQVQVANNGREAVELFAREGHRFDMILMDLEMPEMDGYEATSAIRQGQVNPVVPIVAITAQAMRGDRERCLAAGMDGYLSKPIKPDMLYRTLSDMVRTGITKKDINGI